jgi:hypothetical protein
VASATIALSQIQPRWGGMGPACCARATSDQELSSLQELGEDASNPVRSGALRETARAVANVFSRWPCCSRRGWFTEGLDALDLKQAKALLEQLKP